MSCEVAATALPASGTLTGTATIVVVDPSLSTANQVQLATPAQIVVAGGVVPASNDPTLGGGSPSATVPPSQSAVQVYVGAHGGAIGWTVDSAMTSISMTGAYASPPAENDQSVSIGFGSIGLSQGVAIGWSTNGSDNGVAIGHGAFGAGAGAIGIGAGSHGENLGIALGGDASAGSGGISIGFMVGSGINARVEIAGNDYGGTGLTLNRLSMDATGQTSLSIAISDAAPSAGGAIDNFTNADNTLAKTMIGFRVDAAETHLKIFYTTSAGVVKSAIIPLI